MKYDSLIYCFDKKKNHQPYIQGVSEKSIHFHNPITRPVLIKMISNSNSMSRNNSKFYAFFFSGTEMPFTGKERVFKY